MYSRGVAFNIEKLQKLDLYMIFTLQNAFTSTIYTHLACKNLNFLSWSALAAIGKDHSWNDWFRMGTLIVELNREYYYVFFFGFTCGTCGAFAK